MKWISISALAAAAVACAIAAMPLGSGRADDEASPIFGIKIPAGYRQWELIAPSHETGSFNELRGILGNAISMKAYREGTLPFPDGAMLAKLAWKREPSAEFEGAFVPGHTTTVQIMVKDSKKYASTGGADGFELPAIAAPAFQEPARLIVAQPLADALARGLVVIQYRAENLRIAAVFAVAALSVLPRIGHVHVTVDDARWHWVDTSGELIIQGLTRGPHRVQIELADPMHHVIASKTIKFTLPNPKAGTSL